MLGEPIGRPDQKTQLQANIELVKSLEPVVQKNLHLLLPPEKIWQPTDILSVDFSRPKDEWTNQILVLQQQSAGLSAEVLVTLIGNTVTEEGLPLFMASLVKSEAFGDRTGTDDTAWAKWARGWTAEEKRHGDLLMRFLLFTGRVNVKAVDKTNQSLIRNGFTPNDGSDPLQSIVFTTVQEKATNVSHNNEGRLATQQGDETLAKICKQIASDENRHFAFYRNMFMEALRLDPDRAMIAFHKLMEKQVVMPGRLMDDGVSKDAKGQPNIFDRFSAIAEAIGVYTFLDYAKIFGDLIREWEIEKRQVSGEGAKAQEAVIRLQQKHARVAEIAEERKRRKGTPQLDTSNISWLQPTQKPDLGTSGVLFRARG